MNLGIEPLQDESAVMIDLTSLIDVLFVLLLFFMVTTTFSDTEIISVKLPSAKSGASQPVKKDLLLSITKDGKIYLDGKLSEKDLLAEEFARARASAEDLTLIVRADKEVEHGIVVSAIDAAKSNGLDKIAIATISESN